jgi:hypothetical protein
MLKEREKFYQIVFNTNIPYRFIMISNSMYPMKFQLTLYCFLKYVSCRTSTHIWYLDSDKDDIQNLALYTSVRKND